MKAVESDLLSRLGAAVGPSNVLVGADALTYGTDWTGAYVSHPRAVVRPVSTAEVAAVVRTCVDAGIPMVPVSGNSGLAGGTLAEGAVMISLARMNRIVAVRPEARVAVVEAGATLAAVHEAAAAQGLAFPLTFGARGTAMIGGCLATNAGGSNAIRYGTARALCLGIKAVLPTGEVLDLMSELRKDNTGYDLRDLLIGSEGTLGIITRAVLALVPAPLAHATAMVAAGSLPDALDILNRLQSATGGAVEAFEYMPAAFVEAHLARFPDARPPFSAHHEVNLLVEVAATAERDARVRADGTVPLRAGLEDALSELMEAGLVQDAVLARNEAERTEMWARREAAGEIAVSRRPLVNNDIAVPLDRVEAFLRRMADELAALDPSATVFCFAHLGDGNIHYTVWPGRDDTDLVRAIARRTEAVAVELGGTFSAEHGIGISKTAAMAALKDPVALDVMRRIKATLDPAGLMNPGKVLPG